VFHPPHNSLISVCLSRLCGVVVTVLATGPTGRGFKLGRGDGFLREIEILSTSSFRLEVKPEVPCRKMWQHVEVSKVLICKILTHSSIPPTRSQISLLVVLPESSGHESGVLPTMALHAYITRGMAAVVRHLTSSTWSINRSVSNILKFVFNVPGL
jgi:hypothetical protein